MPARVAGFAGAQTVRAGRAARADGLPPTQVSRALLAQVALDELVLALMKRPDRYPSRNEIARVVAELQTTLDVYRREGWDSDPLSYHQDPPPLREPRVRSERWLHTPFERLSWVSGFEPRTGLPGRTRWLADTRNRTAHALVLRHPGPPRPWVVCLHGLGTGVPAADIPAFRVRSLHHQQGLNVILPVLPRHGPRGPGRLGAQTVLTYDHGEAVLAVAQAVWDVRRAVDWVRSQGGERIGLHGISFGGLVASLLAALSDEYAVVVAGIPVVDIPSLFKTHVPLRMRRRAWLAEVLGDDATRVHRVVSPLAAAPRVPADRLFVYAGIGDRMVPPAQALALTRHWAGASALWFPGDHIGAGWSREVRRFVDSAFAAHLGPEGLPAGGEGREAGQL